MVALLIGQLVYLLVPAVRFSRLVHESTDFRVVYSSAKCLLDHCKPYDAADMRRVYLASGGDNTELSNTIAFRASQALYPPSALFWIVPYSLLPWKSALAAWLATSELLFVFSTFLIADICSEEGCAAPLFMLGVFVGTSVSMQGNPSSVAISLCVIAVWCLLKHRAPLVGVVCFALCLTLKPQVGGLILLYFLFSGGLGRRRSLQILVTTALFCAPGLLWITQNPEASRWSYDLRANIFASISQGGMNDPGPTNWWGAADMTSLPSLIATFINVPRVYNTVGVAVSGVLLLLWAFLVLRSKHSLERDMLCIGSIACLALLPVYHRSYDLHLLVLVFPAVAVLIAKNRISAWFGILISVLIIVSAHPHLIRQSLGHFAMEEPLRTLTLLICPLPVLFVSLFSLVCLGSTVPVREEPTEAALAYPLSMRHADFWQSVFDSFMKLPGRGIHTHG